MTASRSAIQVELVSTIWPSNSSVPTAMTSARTGSSRLLWRRGIGVPDETAPQVMAGIEVVLKPGREREATATHKMMPTTPR